MLPARLRILYLHGFASSPASRKARFFAERLAELGVTLEIPDLCENHFESLTITGQLKIVERTLAAAHSERVVLIGSSLGGYLAALYAARHSGIDRLVLLAPAFQFRELWSRELGPQRMAAWREAGSMPVFHYGEGRELPLAYSLMEDAAAYESFPVFSQPALIFHGTLDSVVPVQQSVAYAEARQNVGLVPLESGHELTDVLEQIWTQTKDFLLFDPQTEVLD